MHPIVKSIGKIVISQLAPLLVVVATVIAITGIPTNFDMVYVEGRYEPTMSREEIWTGVQENFLHLFRGEAKSINILGDSVGTLLATAAKKSARVLFFGTLLALLIGIPKGIVDSRKRDMRGTFKMLQSLIPLSVPDILTIGLVQMAALYLFRNNMTILGLGPIEFVGDETWYHVIYPTLSISLLPAAYIARITANTVEEGFAKPYILAARGKGCSRLRIIKNHLMKSVVYEVLSGFPMILGLMFSSLVIVERLFHYRGIGYHLIFFYTSNRILPYDAGIAFTYFILAMAVFYYLVFMMFNFLKEMVLPAEPRERRSP